jgi:coenzyme F420 hydrogenase subunit beta
MALVEEGIRFAVIAKPCDIAALRNLARTDARVGVQIPYMLTMICEGVPDFESTVAIAARHGVAQHDVTLLRYRGYGWPGPTRVETDDGRVFEQSYTDTWRGDVPYNLQFRCKVCPDAVGLQADIVAGDAWLTGEPRKEVRDGWNCVLSRTRRGTQLLAEAEAAGVLHLEEIDFEDLDAMQPQHVRRRQAIVARMGALASAGHSVPKLRRLQLLRLAAAGGWRSFIENFRGTRARVIAGQAREPTRP